MHNQRRIKLTYIWNFSLNRWLWDEMYLMHEHVSSECIIIKGVVYVRSILTVTTWWHKSTQLKWGILVDTCFQLA